jgi:hypothetical protein
MTRGLLNELQDNQLRKTGEGVEKAKALELARGCGSPDHPQPRVHGVDIGHEPPSSVMQQEQ